jgi:HK97 family phage portal protein
MVRAPRPDAYVFYPWFREAGVAVTTETAVQVAAVYGCCRLIVDSLAPAPITVSEIQREGRRKTLHDDPVGWILNYGANVQSHEDALPAQAIEEALYWSALAGDGNGYAEIQRDSAGHLVALWPMVPGQVVPRRTDAGELVYEVAEADGNRVVLPPSRIFHLRGPSLRGWVGDSTVYRAVKAIGIAQAAQILSSAYFANGTVLGGYLKSDKTVQDEQKRSYGEAWRKQFQGPDKAYGIPFLDQGTSFQTVTQSAKDAQLIEARRFQVAEIARFYGVPLTLLADNEAWTNLGELYLGFYRNALRPWSERFDAEATRKLFPQRQPWREVEHDLTHLTLGSFKDQIAALVQATGGKPIWTQNEARAVFGMNSQPRADTLEPVQPPKPSEPVRTEPEEDEEGEQERPPMVREAVMSMLADAFRRHYRRTKARRTNVRRELHAAERDGFVRSLEADCAGALALATRAGLIHAGRVDLDRYAQSMDEGEPPDKAAERALCALEKTR